MQPSDLADGAVSAEAFRLASLERILTEAAAAGSPRKVIGAFVEAVGVWADIRVRAYAAGTAGGFFHYVSPVGVLPSSVPSSFEGAVAPDHGPSRLSRDEANRLGLASEPGDIVMVPLFNESGLRTDEETTPVWLLVCSGAIDDAEQERLTNYSELLRESLDEVYEIASNRMIASVLQHQPRRDELEEPNAGAAGPSLEAAAQAALEQVAAGVGAGQAALVVTTVTGIRALAVGSADLLSALDQPARTDRLAVMSTHTASFMTVVADRNQRPFMAFERAILDAGVSVLHPWIQAALFGAGETERRRQFTPLETVFDQLAARAVDDGQAASVIVMSVDPALVSPEQLQSWLGTIRVQLRAGDFAGILSDNEIAVLLCDTSADQAAFVSSRLKQIVETDQSAGIISHPAVGTTTRSPELPFVGSLVRAARTGAAKGSGVFFAP